MKKIILSTAFLLAVCISAKAQFSLGIKGGVNYSTINSDNLKRSSVAGYQAGVFARFGNSFYVQPEVYVSSTGGHFESNDNNYSGNVKFTNLNVPLLLGYKFGQKNLNFRVMAGPIYTSLMNKNESLSQNFDIAYSDFGHYRSSTLGYQAGAGVDIGAITADLRYEGNLTDVNFF
jgi:hypothetical protein